MRYFIIHLFQASTCFEHMCSSSGGQKLYYTVSGIVTPIGGCPVHRLREDWMKCMHSIQPSLNLCTGPIGVMITETVLYKFCPPDDEHMCSKHVEA